jgi:hypothetical protein
VPLFTLYRFWVRRYCEYPGFWPQVSSPTKSRCGEKLEGVVVEGRDTQLNTLSPIAAGRKESGAGNRLIHPPFPISLTPTTPSTHLHSSRNHVPILIHSYVASSFLYSLLLGRKTNH